MKEEGEENLIHLSVEQGITGGIPSDGSDFGLVYNPEVILEAPNQFDWYDGGGLDVAILSFAEFDQYGNVNVSRFGSRVNGVGGFINISQAAKKVIFVGTLTAGGVKVDLSRGMFQIQQEGRVKKAVDQVAQISFSGKQAQASGQKVLFVTERSVFELTDKGIELREIAPGADLQKDILDQMEFSPVISQSLTEMPMELFQEKTKRKGR